MSTQRLVSAMQELSDSNIQIVTWPKCVIAHNEHASVMIKTIDRDRVECLCEAIEKLKFTDRGIAACTVDACNVSNEVSASVTV